LDGQKVELQISLEQTKKLIRDLVKDRAAFFVSSETTSEVGEGEGYEFDLASVVNSPEQSERIEQLFQKSLEELITKKEELEAGLKETIIKIDEMVRNREKLETALDIEKYGEDKLNDMEMKRESTDWQQAELRNEIAKIKQKTRDRKVMSKNSELENQQLEKQFYLVNKPLPEIPSKFKQLRAEIKTKFRESAERAEVSSQKLITEIEVKTK
jgi:hypothetical protein